MSVPHFPFTPQNHNEARDFVFSLVFVCPMHGRTSVNTCLPTVCMWPFRFFLRGASPGGSGEAEQRGWTFVVLPSTPCQPRSTLYVRGNLTELCHFPFTFQTQEPQS